MASKKRAKRETIRGMGNDPLILDPMRWGEVGPAAGADERHEPEHSKLRPEPERRRRTRQGG